MQSYKDGIRKIVIYFVNRLTRYNKRFRHISLDNIQTIQGLKRVQKFKRKAKKIDKEINKILSTIGKYVNKLFELERDYQLYNNCYICKKIPKKYYIPEQKIRFIAHCSRGHAINRCIYWFVNNLIERLKVEPPSIRKEMIEILGESRKKIHDSSKHKNTVENYPPFFG